MIERLRQPANNPRISVLDAAKPYTIAALYQYLQKPIMVITAQPEKSKKLYEQISMWHNSPEIKLFPEPDILPYQRIAYDSSTEMERLQVLFTLTMANSAANKPLIITSAASIMQNIIPYDDFTGNCHIIKTGMEIEPLQLLRQWESIGYNIESTVDIPGTISHRGGIIDIFPPSSELPARIEFFGNTIDNIRLFDPTDQRSVKSVLSVAIIPATELPTFLSNNQSKLKKVVNNLDLN
ncbi:MAG: hypothetical protein PHQ86_09520, partial [Dehalococcoidales bacterium]|nr:hypothetical protein [Dehalococcoidales bacterium]